VRLRVAAAVLALALVGCGGGHETSSTDGGSLASQGVQTSGGGSRASEGDLKVGLAQRTIGSYCLRAPNHLSASGFKGMLRAAYSINGAAVKDPAAYRDDLARAIRQLRSCDPSTYRKLKATFDTLR
jgi:hypothetical protein